MFGDSLYFRTKERTNEYLEKIYGDRPLSSNEVCAGADFDRNGNMTYYTDHRGYQEWREYDSDGKLKKISNSRGETFYY